MEEFPKKPNIVGWEAASQRRDAEKIEKKRAIVAALKTLVDAEVARDPKFDIGMRYINETLKAHPELFPGVKNYAALMKYFSNDSNDLRVLLGLPIKAIKGRDY